MKQSIKQNPHQTDRNLICHDMFSITALIQCELSFANYRLEMWRRVDDDFVVLRVQNQKLWGWMRKSEMKCYNWSFRKGSFTNGIKNLKQEIYWQRNLKLIHSQSIFLFTFATRKYLYPCDVISIVYAHVTKPNKRWLNFLMMLSLHQWGLHSDFCLGNYSSQHWNITPSLLSLTQFP